VSESDGTRTLVRWTVAFWVAFTLLDIVKDHIFKDFGVPLSWRISYMITTDSIIFWGSWGLLTPLVYRLVRRYPPGRLRLARFMATHLTAAVLFGFLHLLLASSLFHLRSNGYLNPGHIMAYVEALAGGFLLHDVVVYWGLTAVCIAWTRGVELRHERLAAAELESQVARLEAATTRARLAALRRQLDPHFLFNALNAASGLARRGETRRVTAMLARLGDLLREGLTQDDAMEAPLEKELRWLSLYFAIERERFQDRLEVNVDVPRELHEGLVPAFVLQPLVENAMRHGVAPDAISRVDVRASRHDGRLTLGVQDNGPGLPDRIHDGVGLSNTRERLHQLYGSQGTLSIERGPQGGTRASVELPWHTEPAIVVGAADE
jgi:signal transduction histidine kinase